MNNSFGMEKKNEKEKGQVKVDVIIIRENNWGWGFQQGRQSIYEMKSYEIIKTAEEINLPLVHYYR